MDVRPTAGRPQKEWWGEGSKNVEGKKRPGVHKKTRGRSVAGHTKRGRDRWIQNHEERERERKRDDKLGHWRGGGSRNNGSNDGRHWHEGLVQWPDNVSVSPLSRSFCALRNGPVFCSSIFHIICFPSLCLLSFNLYFSPLYIGMHTRGAGGTPSPPNASGGAQT